MVLQILKYCIFISLLFFVKISLAQPINDEPCNAIELNSDTICNYSLFTNVGSTTSIGVVSAPCANYQGNDVWFKISVPANGHVIIDTQMGTFSDGGIAAYTGTCSSLEYLDCDDDGSFYDAMPKLILNNLTPGSILFLRFWKYNGGSGNFSICSITPNNSDIVPDCSGNQPAGNDCLSAAPICDINGYCGSTSSLYTANFWPELQSSFCSLIENNSFISFVASETVVSFKVWITDVMLSGNGIQLFVYNSIGCTGPVNSFLCWSPGYPSNTPVILTVPGLIIGETYYIMIDGYGGAICDYTIASFTGIALPVTVSIADTTICSGQSVPLTASGGNGTYNWNSSPILDTNIGETVIATPPNLVGTYSVTVNSPSLNIECNANSSFTALINVVTCPNCSVIASNSGPVCVGGSINLFSTTIPVGTYSWTGPNGYNSINQNPSNVIVPINPGSYTYTVSVDMGDMICTSQTIVTVLPQPSVSSGTYNSICSNSPPILLQGIPSGGTFSGISVNNNYFNPNQGTQTILYLYVDSNGCSNYSSVNVTVNSAPIISAGNYTLQCINNDLTPLIGTPVGGTFSGIGVTTNFFDPGVGSQNIEYFWTDSLGCSNSDTTTIFVFDTLSISAGDYPDLCPNDDILVLNGSPQGGFFSGIGVTANSFNPSFGTQIISYFFDEIPGCEITTSVIVNVSNVSFVNSGSYNAVCSDSEPILLEGFPLGGLFSGIGVTGNTFNPNFGSQTIYYIYENSIGCFFLDSVLINIYSLPSIYAGEDILICKGTQIQLSGTGGINYQWSDGVVNNELFSPSIGVNEYVLSGYSENNCVNTDSVLVTVLETPESIFSSDLNIYYPDALVTFTNNSLSSNFFYWNFGNGQYITTNDLNNQIITYSQAGTYLVELIVSNGICSDSYIQEVIVLPFPPPLIIIPNVFSPNDDYINDFFMIESHFIKDFKMVVLNRWGNEIYKFNNVNDKWDGKTNGQTLSDGVYFYSYELAGLNGDKLNGHGFFTLIK